jgi:hypothetical protein
MKHNTKRIITAAIALMIVFTLVLTPLLAI